MFEVVFVESMLLIDLMLFRLSFEFLIYPTLTKGKLGDKQMAWYKENLINPYSRAMDNLSKDRVQLLTDFKALKKELNVPKDLRKEAKTGFTKEQAVRVYIWNKQKMDIDNQIKKILKVINFLLFDLIIYIIFLIGIS